MEISEHFLAKYNQPGPRYTSYPTAPAWRDDFGAEELEKAFRRAEAKATPVSLYVHIPFCQSLCLFCACNVVIQKNKEVASPYLKSLQAEMDFVSQFVAQTRPVVQLHWGGGTPTYLSPSQMEDLFGHMRRRFRLDAAAEVGIEVDPRVTTNQHLETATRLGFNRLSMGIQDFEAKVQETVHRVQPLEMTRDLILAARDLGFQSINVDLIYGLPYQTASSFEDTVGKVIALNPDRIAMFSYAHVPWLKKQQGSFQAHLPEGMDKFRIFQIGLLRFQEAGYQYIGMDHFARPSDELAVAQGNRTLHRNFQGYTTKAGADLYGLGVSAISAIGRSYGQNHRELGEYQRSVTQQGTATMRGYELSSDDLVRRDVIGRLLCHSAIAKADVERAHCVAFDEYFEPELNELRAFEEDGLVELLGHELRVTPLGRIFVRNVAMVFDPYLKKQRLTSRPIFSKTL